MNIFVFSGSGLSAESGLDTFRGSGGLWSGHPIEDVATPQGFKRNPEVVHAFYNARRKELSQVIPNSAHRALSRLQQAHDGKVYIVTQNIDDLLERAGCRDVIHMHGYLYRCRCLYCKQEIEWREDTHVSLLCPLCGKGGPLGALRPSVVWFNEIPLDMPRIETQILDSDLFIAIGTSGLVYPAADFSRIAKERKSRTLCFNLEEPATITDFDEFIAGPAGETVPQWVERFLCSPSL